MQVITRTRETRQPIFVFSEASGVGLNLFAGKTVHVLDPKQPRTLYATAQRRASLFGVDFFGERRSRRFFGEVDENTRFTEWYCENAGSIANDIVKKIGAEGSNIDLKSLILKSPKFYELTREVYLGPYLATTKLNEKNLQIIFQDILFAEEVIQIASFEDLLHGLMIAENGQQIERLQYALSGVNKTYKEYLKLADVYCDREMYENALKCYDDLLLVNKNDVRVLSRLAFLYSRALGYRIDPGKAVELSERALAIKPSNSTLAKNLYILHTEYGKKEIASLYNNYSRLLASNISPHECEVLYKDLKSAIAAIRISIGTATDRELRSAIDAYEKGAMGLFKDIRIIVFLRFRLMEIANPNQAQFVKNLQRLINIGVEFSRINLLLMHPKGEKIADTLANGVIQSEFYDHHIISTITYVDSSFVKSTDKKRFANLLLSLCSTKRLSIGNCQFILNSIYLDLTDEMILVFFKHGNAGWQYTKLYAQSNPSKRQYLQAVLFPYLKKRINQLESKLPGPFLNITRILKDPEASKWSLSIRKKDISDNQWLELYGNLELKMILLFDPKSDGDKQLLLNALQWFDNIPATQDAKVDLQMMRKRVASIVDYINQQDVDAEIAKEVVKILAVGGTACADRVSVALDQAEMCVKAFSKKNGAHGRYIINVIVNEFKRNIISAKFIDPNYRESIETYLYHLNLLNIPLGLESLTKGMLYSSVAMKTSLNKAMEVVYSVFSEENLIGFAQDHALMQKLFRTDPTALKEFEQLMDWDLAPLLLESEKQQGLDEEANLDKYTKTVQDLMVCAPSIEALKVLKEWVDASYYTAREEVFTNYLQKAAFLEQLVTVQLEKMISNFKAEKTKILLKEAGFLSDTAEYDAPDEAYWKQ